MTRNRLVAFISAGVLTLGVGAGATSALAAGSPPAQPVSTGAAATQPVTAAMRPVATKEAVKTPIKHAAHGRNVRHAPKPAALSTKTVRPAKGLKNAAPRKATVVRGAARVG
jgi:hypothetical protein